MLTNPLVHLQWQPALPEVGCITVEAGHQPQWCSIPQALAGTLPEVGRIAILGANVDFPSYTVLSDSTV